MNCEEKEQNTASALSNFECTMTSNDQNKQKPIQSWASRNTNDSEIEIGSLTASTSIKRKLKSVPNEMHSQHAVYISSDEYESDTFTDIEKPISITAIHSAKQKKTQNPLEVTNGEIGMFNQSNGGTPNTERSKADTTFMETIMCMMDDLPPKMKIELKSKIFNLSTKYQTVAVMGGNEVSYNEEYKSN